MTQRKIPEPKPLFIERMKKLLPEKKDFGSYLEILKKEALKSIRCNNLKISPEELKKRLEKKNWKINQPWKKHPEVIIIEGYKDKKELAPGELGRTIEHLLGYYYVQEIASMMPSIVLRPEEKERILDLCASPGSKTTQIASKNSKGTIIANDVSLKRIKILSANLERCGVSNVVITKNDGFYLCNKVKRDFKFDKILIDAPCSGEGTLRSSYRTYKMWNIKTIKSLSKLQKRMVTSALGVLGTNGILVYSTCTHGPEENEEVVDFILKNFKGIKLEKIELPEEIKTREGITEWQGKTFSEEIKKCARIYPHDNNTEGFFIARFKKTD